MLALFKDYKRFQQVHNIFAGMQGSGKYKILTAIGIFLFYCFPLINCKRMIFLMRAIVNDVYL